MSNNQISPLKAQSELGPADIAVPFEIVEGSPAPEEENRIGPELVF